MCVTQILNGISLQIIIMLHFDYNYYETSSFNYAWFHMPHVRGFFSYTPININLSIQRHYHEIMNKYLEALRRTTAIFNTSQRCAPWQTLWGTDNHHISQSNGRLRWWRHLYSQLYGWIGKLCRGSRVGHIIACCLHWPNFAGQSW